jgi:outer membrane protein TolC
LLKWGRLRARVKSAKVRPQAASHKKVFTPQKGLHSVGGPKLLKWGRLRARVKSAKVRPQAASHKKVFAPQKKVFTPRADQSC